MFWVPLVVTASLLLSKSSAIPLTGFYPFGRDEGDQLQLSGDDEQSLVKLSVPYHFFGKEYINVTVSLAQTVCFNYCYATNPAGKYQRVLSGVY